ncbi:hypothetical protein D3C81_612790 [compost metagenome]
MIHIAHLAMVHARHRLHAAVAHVGHGQDWSWVRCGNFGAQARATGECAAGITAAVHALGIQGVGRQIADANQHIVGLGHGDAQFIDFNRLYRLAVGSDYRQFQAGDAEVEIAHR